MTRRKRRQFTAEFKADCVRLCKTGGRTIGEVTREFELTETALRKWVKQSEEGTGQEPRDALASEERAELVELRRRVKRLEMERDILKKAAVFFAKENA